jgi:SAM-dependent methyltransferase
MYSTYASIYDAINQGSFATELAAHILTDLPAPPQHLLDLACGTGAAALFFAAHGATVVGVDRSPAMLSIAQARARDVRLPIQFVEADLRRLPIRADGPLAPATFDLVTCLYDSLNYLLDDGDLHAVCAAVQTMLRPGGRFVFDLNTEDEFLSWGDDECDQVVHDAGGIFVYNRLSYKPAERRAYGRIVWFVRDAQERWWRDEETHVERAWYDAEVLNALADSGLRLLARRTPRWEPADARAPRVVYCAEKSRRDI